MQKNIVARTIVMSLAVMAAALAFQASSAEAIEVDPVIWQLTEDYPSTLPDDVTLPINTVYIKTHDGTDWMSTYDDHPAAVSGPAAIKDLIGIYGDQDIELAAWFVPKGTDYSGQLQRAKQVIDAGVVALYADLEPFAGFCNLQCHELAENFWKPLRQQRPNAHLGVIYDPRPWWWDQSATSKWLSVADSALPMCYWEDFAGQGAYGDPAGCVVQAHADLEGELAPGRDLDYIPMLQGNYTTAARFQRALDAAAGVGSERVSVWRRGVIGSEVWELIGEYTEPGFTQCRAALADGCLFRLLSSGAVYLTQGGAKFLTPSRDVRQAMGFRDEDVQLVEEDFLDDVPWVPRDGTLLSEHGSPEVYLVQAGARFLLAEGDYAALGLDPDDTLTVPPGKLQQITTVLPDFSRFSEVFSEDEYVVISGMRVLIDEGVAAALHELGFGDSPTHTVPGGALDAIPEAEVGRGDTDCSGYVDTPDVLNTLHLSINHPNGAVCHQSADVNCDGTPSTVDALLILVFVAAGESPPLPSGCEPIGTVSQLHPQ